MEENIAAQAADINWELFLGLFFPAFGALQVWLIKIAREDRELYWLVRKQVRKMGWGTIYSIMIVGLLAKYAFSISSENLYFLFFLSPIFILALMITITSLPFYDAVASLPPKNESAQSKSNKG